MGLRQIRRRLHKERIAAQQRFRRQKNANLLARPGAHEFVIILDRLKPAFNIGKIFRSADALGAREVHLIGIDFFDPAPAMGSFKWVPARFHGRFETCYQNLRARGYTLFTLDPDAGLALDRVALPRRSAFIFGHEERGISSEITVYPGIQPLRIPQCGRVQSLNVSIAASIAMWEYLRQHPQAETAGAKGGP
ncbi:MAG: TrmH family RNA methyltransferase [Desulfobacterales bacterium]|jgi:tRNA G18 (ribose-2'-O)-methylase SpoU